MSVSFKTSAKAETTCKLDAILASNHKLPPSACTTMARSISAAVTDQSCGLGMTSTSTYTSSIIVVSYPEPAHCGPSRASWTRFTPATTILENAHRGHP